MNQEIEELELYRKRWRRARSKFRLTNPDADDFGTGGLAKFVAVPSVRFLILPTDPENEFIEFDEEFWTWWLETRTDPVPGRRAEWGHNLRPTAHAALRTGYPENGNWAHHLALFRHGGLEVELGSTGYREWNGKKVFFLIWTVGRLWAAMDLYRSVIDRFGLRGPWEASLAMRQTGGSFLGNFGEGWAEPHSHEYEARPCAESHVFMRREIDAWPTGDGVRELAFSFGARMEDAWGVRQRRFLAHRGDLAGQFDSRRYS